MDLKEYSEDRVNTEQILSINPLKESRAIISLSMMPICADYPEDDTRPYAVAKPKLPDYYLSRNAKGCIVATASNIPILDFDYTDEWAKRFTVAEFEHYIIDQLENFTTNYRLYKTANGWRLILTDTLVKVKDFNFFEWESVGSDFLYNMLCQRFGNFRARLTPKPERVGVPNLYEVFDTKQFLRDYELAPPAFKEQFQQWLQDYEAAASNFATCRLVKFRNDDPAPEEVSKFIELHDTRTRAHQAYPLA